MVGFTTSLGFPKKLERIISDPRVTLVAAPGLLPPGARRAGLLAHAYRAQLVGLSTRTFTGWLEVTPDGATIYAPHTSRGFVAPPSKNLLLVSNGCWRSSASGRPTAGHSRTAATAGHRKGQLST